MKQFLKYHLLSFSLAVLLAFLILIVILNSSLLSKNETGKKVIKGTFLSTNFAYNMLANDSLELQLYGSLQDKDGITLMASSELTGTSEYIPFAYLPLTKGIRVNAFGHAFQQSFAIYCQLLALKKELKNAKVCVILSPGWFETEGTNIEAFLEFVKPNFLKKIARDQTISADQKDQIATYLYKNRNVIENPNSIINYYINLKKYEKVPFLNSYFKNRWKEFESVEYGKYTVFKTVVPKRIESNWEDEMKKNQDKFLASITNNKIYVNDAYYSEYLKQDDGSFIRGKLACLPLNSNQELKDFKLLVNLLKQENCDASFIIQGMNPYYYDGLESFNPILKEIKNELNQAKFPYYDMFAFEKKQYEPGTLADIMHLGDFGWLRVDKFLCQTYVKK